MTVAETRFAIPAFSLRDALGVLSRHRRPALALWGTLVGAVALYCFFWPPTYEARVRFLVKHERQEPLLSAEQGGVRMLSRPAVTEEDLNSEVAVMQSAAVLEATVRELGLENLREHWALRAVNWPIERVAALYGWYHDRPPADAAEKAVSRLRRKMLVAPQKKSAVIEVALQWGHPEAATRILESLSRSYLQQHLALRGNPERETFFGRQAERKKAELQALDGEIRAIRLGAGSAAVNVEKELAVKTLSDLESELRRNRTQRARVQARARTLQRQLEAMPERVVTQDKAIVNQFALDKLKSRVLELRLRRTQLRQKYQPGHRAVAEAEEELEQAEAMLAAEQASVFNEKTTDVNRVAETMRQELLVARAELASLSAFDGAARREQDRYRQDVAALNQDSFRVQALERERRAAEESYVEYVRRHEEAIADDEMNRTRFVNVSPIEPVRAGSEPVKPRRGLLLQLALAAGAALGGGLAFLLEARSRLATRPRTGADVEPAAGAP